MNARNFEHTDVLHGAIRKILLEDWDPLGVSSLDEAKNEYDGYIDDVLRMIADRRSKEEFFDFLMWAEEVHIGLSPVPQRTEVVASRLSLLQERIADDWNAMPAMASVLKNSRP